MNMRHLSKIAVALGLLASPVWAQNSPFYETDSKERSYRAAPKRLSHKSEVKVSWVDTLPDCDAEKVCVQGQLKNVGGKTAHNLVLQINIGGTKYIKPKTVLYSRLDSTTMEPGDQQEFYVEIDRKVHYKERGKLKTMEVGKYNFKVLPQWTKTPRLTRQQKRIREKALLMEDSRLTAE